MYKLLLGIKEIVNDSSVDNINIDQKMELDLISDKFNMSSEKVLYLYDIIYKLYEDSKNPVYSRSNKIKWSLNEDIFLADYISYYYLLNKRTGNKSKPKTDLFNEISLILYGRTSASVQFHYYALGDKGKKEDNIFAKLEIKSFESIDTNKMGIDTNKMDVDTNETNRESKDIKLSVGEKELDLLDMVIGIVENIDDLGIDVNGLFKGLLLLSNEATNKGKINDLNKVNEDLIKQINDLKSENKQLKEVNLKFKDNFMSIRKEFNEFESLNGKNKLRKINKFKSNVKNLVDDDFLEVKGYLNDKIKDEISSK